MGGVSLCCFVFFFLPSFLLPFLHFFFVRSSFLYLLYYPIWVANAFPRENYASDLFVAAAAPATVRPVDSSYPVHLPPPLGSSFSFVWLSHTFVISLTVASWPPTQPTDHYNQHWMASSSKAERTIFHKLSSSSLSFFFFSFIFKLKMPSTFFFFFGWILLHCPSKFKTNFLCLFCSWTVAEMWPCWSWWARIWHPIWKCGLVMWKPRPCSAVRNRCCASCPIFQLSVPVGSGSVDRLRY